MPAPLNRPGFGGNFAPSWPGIHVLARYERFARRVDAGVGRCERRSGNGLSHAGYLRGRSGTRAPYRCQSPCQLATDHVSVILRLSSCSFGGESVREYAASAPHWVWRERGLRPALGKVVHALVAPAALRVLAACASASPSSPAVRPSRCRRMGLARTSTAGNQASAGRRTLCRPQRSLPQNVPLCRVPVLGLDRLLRAKLGL